MKSKIKKWARKYDKCIGCHTTEIKHKGRGYCLHCHDRKRAEKPKRKLQLRQNHIRYYAKHKDTEEYKQNVKQHSTKRYATEKYKISLKEKQAPYNKFRRFILKGKREGKGMTIIIEGERVKTNIKPTKDNSSKDSTRLMREIKIFTKIYLNERKNTNKTISSQ